MFSLALEILLTEQSVKFCFFFPFSHWNQSPDNYDVPSRGIFPNAWFSRTSRIANNESLFLPLLLYRSQNPTLAADEALLFSIPIIVVVSFAVLRLFCNPFYENLFITTILSFHHQRILIYNHLRFSLRRRVNTFYDKQKQKLWTVVPYITRGC